MTTLKDFYKQYKRDFKASFIPDKDYIRIVGSSFVNYAIDNGYQWEQICRMIESFGFKHVEK